MSCALESPENGTCANRRPVRGRVVQPAPQDQGRLVPLAEGHSVAALAPAPAARIPFAADAPEATFSIAAVVPVLDVAGSAVHEAPPSQDAAELRQGVRSAPPSFRDIKAGRAAAAARTPAAEVRIPIEEIESAQLRLHALPGTEELDALVGRVRRRTAARLARTT